MSQPTLFQEELELNELRERERQLLRREKEFEENQKRIARERIERDSTMPPLEEIQLRRKRKQHEMIVSRGEVANVRRDQNRSLALLILLIVTTCTLVWWGLQLMRGA